MIINRKLGLKILRLGLQVVPCNRAKEWLRTLLIRLLNKADYELLINKGDTVVLVGVISGGGYLKATKCVGREGRVILIEPEKRNLAELEDEVQQKKLRNVLIVPKAASSKKGQELLMVSDRRTDHKIKLPGIVHDSDLRPGAFQSTQKVDVDIVDNILQELGLGQVNFMNISVNGAELEVLKGMERILKGNVKLLVRGRGQPVNKSVEPFLEERGFIVRKVGTGKSKILYATCQKR